MSNVEFGAPKRWYLLDAIVSVIIGCLGIGVGLIIGWGVTWGAERWHWPLFPLNFLAGFLIGAYCAPLAKFTLNFDGPVIVGFGFMVWRSWGFEGLGQFAFALPLGYAAGTVADRFTRWIFGITKDA